MQLSTGTRKYAGFWRPPITAWRHPATGHVPPAHFRITGRRQPAPATTSDRTYLREPVLVQRRRRGARAPVGPRGAHGHAVGAGVLVQPPGDLQRPASVGAHIPAPVDAALVHHHEPPACARRRVTEREG